MHTHRSRTVLAIPQLYFGSVLYHFLIRFFQGSLDDFAKINVRNDSTIYGIRQIKWRHWTEYLCPTVLLYLQTFYASWWLYIFKVIHAA